MIFEGITLEAPTYIAYAFIGLLLIICSVDDILRKRIHVKKIIIFTVMLLIITPFRTDIGIVECITGIMIGLFVVLIAKITKGQIGIGDGLILCVTGLGLGLWMNLEMLCYAFTFATIFSMILLVRNMKNRKRKFPFVPFLFLGYVCCMLFESIGY